MGCDATARLIRTAIVVLSTAAVTKADLWSIDIDLDPAPSPQDGPPFSAFASRNRDFLPYQIIGVVGAYLGVVLILGSLLLTVGRRLRKRAQQIAARPIEMVKPTLRTFDMSPNPRSGTSTRTFPFLRRQRSGTSLNGTKAMSPGALSINSFDNGVVERDKRNQEEQMAQIYGKFYEFEEQRIQSAGSRPFGATQDDRPHIRPDLRPLDLRRVQSPGSTHPASPISPRSPVRAIYPPQSMGSRSPVSTRYQPHPLSEREERAFNPSDDTTDLRAAPLSKKYRRPMGKLTISSPMASRLGDDNSDGARTPLSPRFYTDPGTPPEPPSALTIDGHRRTTSAGTTTSRRDGRAFDDRDHAYDARPVPAASPQRLKPALKVPPTKRGNMAQISTNNVLPFREYQNQYPTSPTALNTKTTVLESKGRSFPLTAGATPYSAYFPGQMIEPATPHLTTRAERLQKQKEEKAVRGAITEEDQVQDESEMWRDAY
ncbi:uncharacterized protein RCC_09844 [Ramularia collo-cygni]|uniref:Uncharacterized protein n=1 Tax=Ramularia collo-cygni TaxID=112498 RepID=A0A2D3V1C7_9PEZI|nr:uncharacterized protein RCC_09844 [Ramularia collo-cygni]CZT24127.1 uncharacterized protein RCC_09844 [Ramularia collo-cygni]